MPIRSAILVVDDEPDILMAVQAFLQDTMAGVQVHTAPDGKRALDILGSRPIDLIVCDYKMPLMDGLQVLEAAAAAAPDVPRVLLTAFPDLDVAIRALNEGHIHRFLTKPVEPPVLAGVVKELLDERVARQQREAALKRSVERMKGGAASGP